MLTSVFIFIGGFALGGIFVFIGMHGAIRRELLKPPLSEEEKNARAMRTLEDVKSKMSRSDPQKAADALSQWAENDKALADADGKQLSMMIHEVAELIGGPSVSIVDGKVFVRPELQRALDKSGNPRLFEMLSKFRYG